MGDEKETWIEILIHICEQDHLSVAPPDETESALRDEFDLDPETLTDNVNHLESAGLVEWSERITPTEQGVEIAREHGAAGGEDPIKIISVFLPLAILLVALLRLVAIVAIEVGVSQSVLLVIAALGAGIVLFAFYTAILELVPEGETVLELARLSSRSKQSDESPTPGPGEGPPDQYRPEGSGRTQDPSGVEIDDQASENVENEKELETE